MDIIEHVNPIKVWTIIGSMNAIQMMLIKYIIIANYNKFNLYPNLFINKAIIGSIIIYVTPENVS